MTDRLLFFAFVVFVLTCAPAIVIAESKEELSDVTVTNAGDAAVKTDPEDPSVSIDVSKRQSDDYSNYKCGEVIVIDGPYKTLTNVHGSDSCYVTFTSNRNKLSYIIIVNSTYIRFLNTSVSSGASFGIQVFNSGFIDFSECDIKLKEIGFQSTNVLFSGSSHINMENCEIGGSVSFGVLVKHSSAVSLRRCVIANASQYAVIFRDGTNESMVEKCSISNVLRGVLFGEFCEECDWDNITLKNPSLFNNSIIGSEFQKISGFNVILGYDSARTNITDGNFSVALTNRSQWACIYVQESYGNSIVRNMISNSDLNSFMYVGIMIENPRQSEKDIPNTMYQNFIELHTDGYGIHIQSPLDFINVCISNIVSDSQYILPTNAQVDWDC